MRFERIINVERIKIFVCLLIRPHLNIIITRHQILLRLKITVKCTHLCTKTLLIIQSKYALIIKKYAKRNYRNTIE
jgi:hypothetical protein